MSDNSHNTFGGDLRELFTDEALSATTPVYIYCPMHPDTHRPSMCVYPDGAYCFTCGAYMSRHKLVRHVQEVDPAAITNAKLQSSSRERKRTRPALRREEREVLARMAHENLTNGARLYFRSRGLSDATIERYQLGHYGMGFTLPIFETAEMSHVETVRFRRDDALVEASCGATFDQPPKYWGLRGSNDVMVYPFPIAPETPTIILTEGEFDALLLRQEGLHAYSLTNGAKAWQKVKTWETFLPRGVAVNLCYDNDAAGQEAAEKMQETLSTAGYTVTRVHYAPEFPKDVTQLRETNLEDFQAFIESLWLWERQTVSARTLAQSVVQSI